MNVGHERWFVQARCQGIHVVEKKRKDQQDSIPRDNVLQPVRPAKVIEWRNDRRGGQWKSLLPVRPIVHGVGVELVSGGMERRISVFLGTIE